MAAFTAQELLFLSNLMHMKSETVIDDNGINHGSPFQNVWTEMRAKNHPTIGSILKKIDTNKLRNDKAWSEHIFDGDISGSEWADMIDTMRQSDICELTLQDVSTDDKKALITYFTDKEGNAYVVFRGTGAGEWEDNFEAAYVADTEQQQRALDYINSINADHITVVGHSKGGNKAKYVALLSEKVDRCVSFDGQGFSRQFMEKYEDLIEKNKHKITCYALDEDFVNILLYDIYNTKYYIEGQRVSSFIQNHSPDSFFNFHYDGSGKAVSYDFKFTNQDQNMATLHSFVNYVDSVVPKDERDDLFTFLGTVTAMALGKKPPNKAEILAYLTNSENADELGLLMAYLIEYEEYDGGITQVALDIMESMGMEDVAYWIKKLEDWFGTENILKFLIKYRDKVMWVLKLLKAPDYIMTLISNIGDAYDKVKYDIKPVSVYNMADYNAESNNNVRDYSQAVRDMLLKLTDEVSNEKPYDIKRWDVWYQMEDWFRLLNIDIYKNNIDDYFRKVIDINGTSRSQLLQIFSNVDSTVKIYKKSMQLESNNLIKLSNNILNV